MPSFKTIDLSKLSHQDLHLRTTHQVDGAFENPSYFVSHAHLRHHLVNPTPAGVFFCFVVIALNALLY